jgi:WD40 repeat protein
MTLKLKGQPALFLTAVIVALFSGCASGTKMTLRAVDKGVVKAVAFSRDGKIVASAGSGRGIKLWDVQTGKVTRTLEGNSSETESIVFSPDGRILASGGGDLRLWDVQTGQLLRTMKEGQKIVDDFDIRGIAFSPDGKTIASAGEELILWDAETGEAIRKFDAGFYVVAISPDGKTIVSVASGETGKLYDIETAALKREFKQGDEYARIRALAFSPDGKFLASAGGGIPPEVKVWNLETWTLQQTLNPYDIKEGFGIEGAAFSPDGKWFASGNGYKGTITVWDTKTWKLKTTFKNIGLYAAITRGGSIEAIAFSPDSKTIASGDQDGMVKLWDLSDLK